MSLERHLVLNRWLHHLLGAEGLEPLTQDLSAAEEGPAGDGQSHFLRRLATRRGLRLPAQRLAEYDVHILDYERRLGHRRGGLTLKYFQYLALLYTEILLDRLTTDPEMLERELNAFLGQHQDRGRLAGFPPFAGDDFRRLAYFLATGAGKTLLLHANLWQIDHYLSRGARPSALVRRADGRAEFEGIYLVTPNEGLSRQHLAELALSNIAASHFVYDAAPLPSLFGPAVRVVEISKLAEEASGDGVSVALDALGNANLVFVDEGHKGAGSEAQAWKRRQQRLSAGGMLLEYSATFAQAIAAAPRRAQEELRVEYGKSIVLDYSYRHFYGEQFGKDFAVLNVQSVREEQAHDVLLNGLLLFYQQRLLFREQRDALRPYQVESPLWVFLGSSVKAIYTRGGRTRSDVATAIAFVRSFLEDRDWAVGAIGRVLRDGSGFRDSEGTRDVFRDRLGHIGGAADGLYDAIRREVFRGAGALELRELRLADGELGLRTSTPDDPAHPYFGVISIGDAPGFRRHVEEHLGLDATEDRFTGSLFEEIERPGSSVALLIGAKKFVEGWSSWRVSAMGLLNVGRGEGPQVIQLFGRGVRLRGKAGSLRRSAARPDPDLDAPTGLRELETLYVFGWNADYLGAFEEMLRREELLPPVEVPIRPLFPELAELLVPRPRAGYDSGRETWTLEAEADLGVVLDLAARAEVMVAGERRAVATTAVEVEFTRPELAGLLNLDGLYAGLLEYKARRGYGNLYIRRDAVLPILRGGAVRLAPEDAGDPVRLQDAALRVLTSYTDRFVARRERASERRELVPSRLMVREHQPAVYVVRAGSEELLRRIQAVVQDTQRLHATEHRDDLPRLHVERHLWSPLLLRPKNDDLQLAPPGVEPGEAKFLADLGDFWARHHDDSGYRDRELYVLRNPPGTGVGFFRRSGFYPDFILWLRDASGHTRVRFVEPHGMVYGGLGLGNRDKIEAFRDLEGLNSREDFQREGLEVGGYLVTETRKEAIPGAEDLDWPDLAREYRLLPQQGDYVARILEPAAGVPAALRVVRLTRLSDVDGMAEVGRLSPAERLGMMWQLATDAWAFTGNADVESRLPRHLVELRRRGR